MAGQLLEPSLSPTYKVVNDQALRVDIYLPPRHALNEQEQRPIVIAVHAGAWIFGSSRLINADQVRDCLSRDWIVLSPQFRLCPQVDILEGPIGDTRACLAWVHSGDLDRELGAYGLSADLDRVASYGMSSGGSIALCLGFDVPKAVRAVFAMCPAIMCGHSRWFTNVERMVKLPDMEPGFMEQVYHEEPVPVEGGVRLNGEWCPLRIIKEPWLNHRSAFMYAQMAKGRLLNVCYPKGVETGDFRPIDPYLNVADDFPATCIAQGTADTFVPVEAPQDFVSKLQDFGVRSQLIEIPGAGHMFTATMKPGDRTYELQKGASLLGDRSSSSKVRDDYENHIGQDNQEADRFWATEGARPAASFPELSGAQGLEELLRSASPSSLVFRKVGTAFPRSHLEPKSLSPDSTQQSMEEEAEAVAVDEALDSAGQAEHQNKSERDKPSPPQADVEPAPRATPVLLSRRDKGQLEFLRRTCREQKANFAQLSIDFISWKRLFQAMSDYKSENPSLIESQILDRFLALDSVSSMRSHLHYSSTPHKLKMRNRILLHTALRRVPEKGAMVLQALLSEWQEYRIPFYMIEDSVGFLASRIRQLDPSRRQDFAQNLASVITEACQLSEKGHIRPMQNSIYLILDALPQDQLEDWFHQLMENGVRLHKYTLVHFASRFAKVSATKDLSLDIWRDLCETASLDINTPVGASLCTSLLTFEDHDLQGLDGISLTPAEIFQCLIDLGLIPNVVTYTTIIRSLCAKNELQTALQVFEVMTQHGVQPDAYTYSVMMNGCKSSEDFDTMMHFALEARAADIRDPVIWNDVIHATFLACLKESRLPGGSRGARCMTWGPMNAIYTRFFDPVPLRALVTSRQTKVREFMELQGVIPARMKRVFYDLSPLPPKEVLQPTSPTLSLMVMGFVRHLPRPYDVILFYDQFKDLLRQGNPMAQMIIQEQGSIIHDIVLRALLKWKGTLRLMLDIISDMMPDVTPARTATDSLSSPTAELKNREESFADLTTEAEVPVVKSTIADLGTPIADSAADIADVESEAAVGDESSSDAGTSDAYGDLEGRAAPICHPPPSVHTWSILVKAFMSEGRPHEAEHTLEFMQAYGVKPNRVTWNTLAAGYAKLGDTKQAVEAMRRLEAAGFENDDYTMRAFSYISDKNKAVEMMEKTLEQNLLIKAAIEQQQQEGEGAETVKTTTQGSEVGGDSLIDRWEQDQRLEESIRKHMDREETPSPGWRDNLEGDRRIGQEIRQYESKEGTPSPCWGAPPEVENLDRHADEPSPVSGEVSHGLHKEVQKPAAETPAPSKPNFDAWDDFLWDHAAKPEPEEQDERQ
ncbi:hypothetical protein diail_4307, partial [Diaporthe ilicicola]